jgi:hypothetical protein
MNREKVTAWVTKHALTKGIKFVNGEVCHDISSTMLTYGIYEAAHGNDWHRTPEAALARAEEMRKAKIASLRKSIAKMEALKFKAPNDRVEGPGAALSRTVPSHDGLEG